LMKCLTFLAPPYAPGHLPLKNPAGLDVPRLSETKMRVNQAFSRLAGICPVSSNDAQDRDGITRLSVFVPICDQSSGHLNRRPVESRKRGSEFEHPCWWAGGGGEWHSSTERARRDMLKGLHVYASTRNQRIELLPIAEIAARRHGAQTARISDARARDSVIANDWTIREQTSRINHAPVIKSGETGLPQDRWPSQL